MLGDESPLTRDTSQKNEDPIERSMSDADGRCRCAMTGMSLVERHERDDRCVQLPYDVTALFTLKTMGHGSWDMAH